MNREINNSLSQEEEAIKSNFQESIRLLSLKQITIDGWLGISCGISFVIATALRYDHEDITCCSYRFTVPFTIFSRFFLEYKANGDLFFDEQ